MLLALIENVANFRIRICFIMVFTLLVCASGCERSEEQKRQDDQIPYLRLTGDANLDFDKIYIDPSIESINAFIKRYPNDKRIVELRQRKEVLLRVRTEQRLLRKLGGTVSLLIDSLWLLREVASNNERFERVDKILKQQLLSEIVHREKINAIQRLKRTSPNDVLGIDSLYKNLERTYFYKALRFKTHYHCVEYQSLVPSSYQQDKERISRIISEHQEVPVDKEYLLNKAFSSDPITVQTQNFPVRLKFYPATGGKILTDIVLGTQVIIGAWVTVEHDEIRVSVSNGFGEEPFSIFKYYDDEELPFIESTYNSTQGYLKLELER